jgi:hypothetical protein
MDYMVFEVAEFDGAKMIFTLTAKWKVICWF